MKTFRPLHDRLRCRVVRADETYGKIVIPERFRKQFGVTQTGAPHVLCRVEAIGPDAAPEISPGDYILVDGLNVEKVRPLDTNGEKDLCFPRDKAILVRFLGTPISLS